jgi:homoaconitate hydratase family protein
VRPGETIVGTDSHTTTHGALGAFAVGIGSTEMAGVLATGELWFRVPETVRVRLEGSPPPGVAPKDVILHVIGLMGAEGASYRAVEFTGPAVRGMSVDGRLTLCNMSAEMGAKNAVIEPDGVTLDYLRGRVDGEMRPVGADPDADYYEERTVDCNELEPLVAVPSSPENVVPVREVESVEVDQAFLGSCTNGRMEDLRAAAEILRGRRISDSVRLIVIPASQSIWAQAEDEGLLKVLQGAGASVCTPSCGPCTGADKGILGPGEACVSTTNRNFVGRMGDPTSEVYLASPFTVAASALTGRITDPRPYLGGGR